MKEDPKTKKSAMVGGNFFLKDQHSRKLNLVKLKDRVAKLELENTWRFGGRILGRVRVSFGVYWIPMSNYLSETQAERNG